MAIIGSNNANRTIHFMILVSGGDPIGDQTALATYRDISTICRAQPNAHSCSHSTAQQHFYI